jgi:hypothetical protein
MKIYVILHHYDYDYQGDDLVSVCNSEELAKSKVLEYNRFLDSYDTSNYYYKECIVEEN